MTLQRLTEYAQKLWRSPTLWFFIGVLNVPVVFVGAYLNDGPTVAVGAASLVTCWIGALLRRWSSK